MAVQEDVIPHASAFVGNPQIFREMTGRRRLLLVSHDLQLQSPWIISTAAVRGDDRPEAAAASDHTKPPCGCSDARRRLISASGSSLATHRRSWVLSGGDWDGDVRLRGIQVLPFTALPLRFTAFP